MKVGFIRHAPRFPVSTQRKALLAAGVRADKIYDETQSESRDAALNGVRDNDVLVVYRLSILYRSRADFRILSALVGERPITILEAATGRTDTLPHVLAEMLADAMDDHAGERNRMTKAEAKRAGKKGSDRRWGAKKRLPVNEARAIWRDTDEHRVIGDALKRMPGWTQRTAYKHFGPRGSVAGRPPKAKQ